MGEQVYLGAVQQVLDKGERRADRTGVGTVSLFGLTCTYDLRDRRIPVIGTKRIFWRGVVEELLWMVRGQTDVQLLAEKGVHFWDANATREFLDKRGLTENKVGDPGPIYGAQWRRFAGHTDQLKEVMRLIKEDPHSRRIVMSAWNPVDLDKMALPPCHVLCQFYVGFDSQGVPATLSIALYQRSGDMGLGVPFNIASYGLLCALVARASGLTPEKLVHTIGDAHIYTTHIDALKEQLTRAVPKEGFPKLFIRRPINSLDDIERLDGRTDLSLEGYDPDPAPIHLDMAV